MNILHVIELTNRYRLASAGDAARRRTMNQLSKTSQELLAEARACGLDLDDVIGALRRMAAEPNQSH